MAFTAGREAWSKVGVLIFQHILSKELSMNRSKGDFLIE